MKSLISVILLATSFSSFAFDSNNCPESFTVTFTNSKKSVLTSEIAKDEHLKRVWDSIYTIDKLEHTYYLIQKTENYCTYNVGKAVAMLRENELVSPFNNASYFRNTVESFSTTKIELIQDEESLAIRAAGDVKVGSVSSVSIKVN